MNNVFADIPAALTEEIVQTLLTSSNLRVERIISLGHSSPDGFWFNQEQNEWVVLLKGAAKLRFENADELVAMQPGSFVNIPAHQRHRVEWSDPAQPTIWLAIHYGG
ncbi:MAG: cupin domain-containing protein [Planctomycetaceae bacterium]|nr:cupin domain-containing protein [Planctomycetaceae bacterium]